MAKQNQVRVRRSNRSSNALPLAISVVFLAALSAVFAFIWQSMEVRGSEEPPYSPSEVLRLAERDASASDPVQGGDEGEGEEDPEPTSSAPPSVVYGQPVPQSTRVTTEFFDDALFVGDSITTGIEGYGVLPNTSVVAHVGINIQNVMTSGVIDGKTFLEAMKEVDAKNIYIMIGANGLNFLTVEQTVNYYEPFLDAVIAQHPDATIYVQSLLPINEEMFAQRYAGELNNQKILEANKQLMELAGRKQVHYLDVYAAFVDEDGGLPEAATTDGLHFKSDYYTKWIDYLKSHVVTEE